MNFWLVRLGFLGIAADLRLSLDCCCGFRVVSVCDFVGGFALWFRSCVLVFCEFAVLVFA